MSALFILIVAAWVLLITVAFVIAIVQAILHFLPRRAAPWGLPLAPTLAELRTTA
jgi:hypothetical protein